MDTKGAEDAKDDKEAIVGRSRRERKQLQGGVGSSYRTCRRQTPTGPRRCMITAEPSRGPQPSAGEAPPSKRSRSLQGWGLLMGRGEAGNRVVSGRRFLGFPP